MLGQQVRILPGAPPETPADRMERTQAASVSVCHILVSVSGGKLQKRETDNS
jgi:hypothetical protein